MTQLGAYVGFPDNADSSINATTNAQLAQFQAATGQNPTLKLLYIDASQPESQWVGNNAWAVASWQADPTFSNGSTPVLGIPMAQPGDTADQDFQQIASGAWDSTFTQIFQAWANAGVKSFYIRPGWEMNGNWMNWSITQANAADFVAAFQHIATLAHNFSGASIKVMFNPNTGGTVPLANYYPGNAAVDAIGLDFYGNPIGADNAPSAASSGPGDIELNQLMAFAQAQGKPFGFSEIGAAATDTAFPTNLARDLTAQGKPISFLDIWDVPGGTGSNQSLQWSSNSAASQAWQQVIAAAEGITGGSGSPGGSSSGGSSSGGSGSGGSGSGGGTAAGTISISSPGTVAAATAGAPVHVTETITAPGLSTVYVTVMTSANVAEEGWQAVSLNAAGVGTYDATFEHSGDYLLAVNNTSNATIKGWSPQISITQPGGSSGGGTTPDTLALSISQDAWKGDAQFRVSVDGQQVGGTYTASALHASGDAGVFLLTGNWGAGQHSVQVSFINDAYGGTPATDRNLYVNAIAYDGTTYANTTAPLYSNGTRTFAVGGAVPTTPGPADTLTLRLAEDAWKGNADFVLYLDGKPITTAQPVTALHNAGQWQDVTVTGNFGAGSHTLGVRFTNDAWGGTPQTDRNLYVGGISLNGQAISNGTASIYTTSTANFTLHTTA